MDRWTVLNKIMMNPPDSQICDKIKNIEKQNNNKKMTQRRKNIICMKERKQTKRI